MQVRKGIALLALGGLCLFASGAHGQTATTGQISGVILDPQGAAVAGVRVSISSQAGLRRESSSDGTGHYAFTLLPPGTYRLEAEKSGFSKAVAEGVVARITETTNLDLRLSLVTKTTSIEVSAAPPLTDRALL
jgi:hypothetical protein